MSKYFEELLSVSLENLEFEFNSIPLIPWQDYYLNPRRLRGSDFLMRWSQGVWSENRLVNGVNTTNKYFALPYGPSSVAPEDDVRAFELYFELLDKAGNGNLKRPDLLIFNNNQQSRVNSILEQ